MTKRKTAALKDRILNARIPEELDRELREQAERLDMPVSQLVRGILQRTVDLVGNLSGNVEHLVTEVVEDVAGFKEAVDGAVMGTDGALAMIIGWQPIRVHRESRCWASKRPLAIGEEAWIGIREDGRTGPVVAQDELEPLLRRRKLDTSWVSMRLHRATKCADSDEDLPIGAKAWMRRDSNPPCIISEAAMEARKSSLESETNEAEPETPATEDS